VSFRLRTLSCGSHGKHGDDFVPVSKATIGHLECKGPIPDPIIRWAGHQMALRRSGGSACFPQGPGRKLTEGAKSRVLGHGNPRASAERQAPTPDPTKGFNCLITFLSGLAEHGTGGLGARCMERPASSLARTRFGESEWARRAGA
jgi:hypothetical protein